MHLDSSLPSDAACLASPCCVLIVHRGLHACDFREDYLVSLASTHIEVVSTGLAKQNTFSHCHNQRHATPLIILDGLCSPLIYQHHSKWKPINDLKPSSTTSGKTYPCLTPANFYFCFLYATSLWLGEQVILRSPGAGANQTGCGNEGCMVQQYENRQDVHSWLLIYKDRRNILKRAKY